MKSLVGKFGTLALLAAVGSGAAAACSSNLERGGSDTKSVAEGEAGKVQLHLVPVSGVTINSVHYEVTGNPAIPSPPGPPLPEGDLPTPGTSDNFGLGLSVPVGTGYVLSLTAVSAEEGDDIRCTGASATFDVAALQTVDFSLTLTCIDYTSGEVVADVTVVSEDCPTILPAYASSIPAHQDVGFNIATNALATDSGGAPIGYSWSVDAAHAAVGHFVNPNSAASTFVCDGIGTDVPLTVTFSNGECDKDLHTFVSCNSVLCGNGTLDATEDCDFAIPADQPGGSPAGTTFGCPTDCSVSCSDPLVEAPTEQCNSGGVDNDTCTAQCRTRVQQCGDGWLTPNELCDGTKGLTAAQIAAGVTCNGTCDGVITPFCGSGTVSGTEECDPGQTGGVTTGSATCSNDCQFVASDDCSTCELGSPCAPFNLACLNSTGTPTPADQALCFDVQECIQDSGCADGGHAFTECFCGDPAVLGTSACNGSAFPAAGGTPVAGVNPNGACWSQIRAGMGAGATPAQVLTRMLNRGFASGAGVNRFNCLKNNATCRPLCGF